MIYLNSTSDITSSVQSASAHIAALLDSQGSGGGEGAITWNTAMSCSSWKIVITRADFKASSKISEMNHWVCCFEDTGKTLADRITELGQDARKQKDHFMDLLRDADPDCCDSILHEADIAEAKSNNFIVLTRRIHEASNVFPQDVEADGNCGIWAFMKLLGQMPGNLEQQHEEMMSLRKQLSDMWQQVASGACSDSASWQQVFRFLATDVALPPDLSDLAAAHERVQGELAETCNLIDRLKEMSVGSVFMIFLFSIFYG